MTELPWVTEKLDAVVASLPASAGGVSTLTALAASRTQIETHWRECDDALLPMYLPQAPSALRRCMHRECHLHLEAIVATLHRQDARQLDFIQDAAATYAEHRLALEAVLRAYHAGQRLVLDALAQAAQTHLRLDGAISELKCISDVVVEYFASACALAAASYLSHMRVLAKVAGDQATELLNVLLAGFDDTDARAAALLRNAGFAGRRLDYCVAVVQPIDVVEMASSARGRRLADAIETLVSRSSLRYVLDVREDKVVAVFCALHRVSGWSASATSVSQRVARQLATLGNGVVVGLSNDTFDPARIPHAYDEARLAVSYANHSHRVVNIAAIPVHKIAMSLVADRLEQLLPSWSDEFAQIDSALGHSLSKTLRVYADTGMNVLESARRLGIHSNTIYARFQRIDAITKLNPRRYQDLRELLTVIDFKHNGVTTTI